MASSLPADAESDREDPPANPYEEAEAEIRAALAPLPPGAGRELLELLMLPQAERAAAIGRFYQHSGEVRALAEKLIDFEADRMGSLLVTDVLKEMWRDDVAGDH